ncbi:hypothetical protein ACX3YD_24930 [Pseudomonas fluorescens group sp. PF-1]
MDNSENLELQAALSLIKEQSKSLAELEQRAIAAETMLVRARSELESCRFHSAESENLTVARRGISVTHEAASNGSDIFFESSLGKRRKLLGAAIPQPSLSVSSPSIKGAVLIKLRHKLARGARGVLIVLIKTMIKSPVSVTAAKKVFARFPNAYHNLRMFAFRRGLLSHAQGKSAGRFDRNGGVGDLSNEFLLGHIPLSPMARDIYTEIKSRMSEQESR